MHLCRETHCDGVNLRGIIDQSVVSLCSERQARRSRENQVWVCIVLFGLGGGHCDSQRCNARILGYLTTATTVPEKKNKEKVKKVKKVRIKNKKTKKYRQTERQTDRQIDRHRPGN